MVDAGRVDIQTLEKLFQLFPQIGRHRDFNRFNSKLKVYNKQYLHGSQQTRAVIGPASH